MRNLKTRPIRSVLARRKMFANGGMMAPNIAPQGPAGILASSQPLMQAAGQQGQFPPPAGQQGQSFVDSMTQDAVNPMGGGTLAMAEGGVAGFENGGLSAFLQNPRQNVFDSYQRPQMSTVTPRVDRETVTFSPGVAVYDAANPISMPISGIMSETPPERLRRLFPESARNAFQLSFDERYPEFEAASKRGEPSSRFEEYGARFLVGAKDLLGLSAVIFLVARQEQIKLLWYKPERLMR